MTEWLPRPSWRTSKKTLRRAINDVLELPSKLRATAAHDKRLAVAADAQGHHERADSLRGQAIGLEGAADHITETVVGGLGLDYDAAATQAEADFVHPHRRLIAAAEDRLYDTAYGVCAAAQDLTTEDLRNFGPGMPDAMGFLRDACAGDHTAIEPAARAVDTAFVPSPAETLPPQVAKFEGYLLVLRSYVRGLDEAVRLAEGDET